MSMSALSRCKRTECPNLTCSNSLIIIDFIQLRCNNLIIVHRPCQTLTDNTDITHRHTIELTNKMSIHPNIGESILLQNTPFLETEYTTLFSLCRHLAMNDADRHTSSSLRGRKPHTGAIKREWVQKGNSKLRLSPLRQAIQTFSTALWDPKSHRTLPYKSLQ